MKLFRPRHLTLLVALALPALVGAQEAAPAAPAAPAAEAPEMATLQDVDILWTCLAAFLVFFMQAGFAFVEGGFTRAKNLINILMKNVMDLSVGSIAFFAVGFGLMFGLGGGWIGTSGFFFEPTMEIAEGQTAAEVAGSSVGFGWAFIIFQTVFAATAATIVSGAMAERTKFIAYLCYSAAICIVVYPIFGHWAWGSLYFGDGAAGWLEGEGFLDFAGSTVVHSVGGWAALAGAIVIGPRLGKFVKGKARPIPGHNMAMGALGVLVLWLGWFGFNAGSTTAIKGGDFAQIAFVTNLAAAAGAIGAMITSWVLFKKPDISMTLNGALAGLVSITAGCDVIGPKWALLTGLLGGIVVVLSVLMFEKVKVDDPVGAISVHGVCGAWGTLAVGLFGAEVGLFTGGGAAQLGTQAMGVFVALGWTLAVSFPIFLAIKYTIGLRVSADEERIGLDLVEHGMSAYHLGETGLTSGVEGDDPGIMGQPVTASR